MFILGLTGSVGMGKSTAADGFRRLGVPVHDADATVHALMTPGSEAFQDVADAFPQTVVEGVIDRARLGGAVFGDAVKLGKLEAILHPRVRAAERHFLGVAARNRRPVVVLDIPLLFETGAEDRCDAVLVVACSERLQRRRVLSRPGMTPEKLDHILARQLPSRDKECRADFVVRTDLAKAESFRALQAILAEITNVPS